MSLGFPVFAEALSSATSFSLWQVSVSAASVVVILERGFAFWKNYLREQPPPAQTYQAKGNYGTAADISALRQDFSARFDKFEVKFDLAANERHQDLQLLTTAATTREHHIHTRIDLVLEKVSELKGRMDEK